MKLNKKLMFLTTIVCISPMILSALIYDKLPDNVAIHFDSAGNANGYAPKFFAVFGLPLIMALINLLGIFMLESDPKKANSSKTLKLIGIWTAPIVSIILTPITIFKALGVDIPINLIIVPLIGILFIICGNYLPKCKQNYTVGIKLPWTLNNSDNWNKTHHLAGYVWIVGGLIITISAFIDSKISFILTIIILVPTIYSYSLYKKRKRKVRF